MSKRRANGEGSAPIKRRDGSWMASFTVDTTGQRRWVYGKTSKDAAKKRDTEIHAQREGRLLLGPDQTVEAYLERWLCDTASVSLKPTTYVTYRGCIRRVVPIIGRHPLRKLTREHVNSCYKQLQVGPHKVCPNTVRGTHVVLSHALKDAVKSDLIAKSPAEYATLPRSEKQEMRTLTRDQITSLLQTAAHHKLYGLWALYVYTGVRRGEGLAVSWKDLDLTNRTLTVRKSLQKIREQGNTRIELLTPKTKTSNRTILLNPTLVDILQHHRKAQLTQRLKVGEHWDDHGLVFCSEIGEPLDPDNVLALFQRLCQRADVPKIRLHDLRHTFATLLFERNVDVKRVATMLGHASVTITYDTYTHLIPTDQQGAIEALDGLLAPAL